MEGSIVAPNTFEMDFLNEVGTETARDVKKQRRKKKARFNYTYRVHVSSHDRSLHRSRNASSNSSKLHRTSLRANNRALARALQQMKEEYRCLHQKYMDGLTEQQELMMNVSELQGFAKINREGVAQEIEKHHADKNLRLREVLNHVTNNLMGTVQLLSEAIEMCEPSPEHSLYTRTTDGSSSSKESTVHKPGSSEVNMNVTTGKFEAMRTSTCIGPVGANQHQPPAEKDGVLGDALKRTAFDMTVIMEQSCLLSDEGETDTVKDQLGITGEDYRFVLESVSEDGAQISNGCKQSLKVESAEMSSSLLSNTGRSPEAVFVNVPSAVLNLSPRKNRKTSCLKKDGLSNLNLLHRRVSFEDTSTLVSQLNESEENKENSIMYKDQTRVSPRRSKRKASFKELDLPNFTQAQSRTVTKPVMQVNVKERDFSNRRETFVITASKQTSRWPSPSSAEKAFGGKIVEKLALCYESNDNITTTEKMTLKKCVDTQNRLSVSEDIIRLPPVEKYCDPFFSTQLFDCNNILGHPACLPNHPSGTNEIDWIEDDQAIESEDQTCLMIHTMELTETLQAEIEHNVPCEVLSQSFHNSSVSNLKLPEAVGIDVHNRVQNSEHLQLEDTDDHLALSIEVNLADTHKTIQCDESQAAETHNKIKPRTKAFIAKKNHAGSRLPKPNYSFFSAKKIKGSHVKKSKPKRTKAAHVSVEDSTTNELKSSADPFSWSGTSPALSVPNESNSSCEEPEENNLHMASAAENYRSSDGLCTNESELVPGPVLPAKILNSPNKSWEGEDTESTRDCLQSPKRTRPIFLSDSSDDSMDSDDETWIPYKKNTKCRKACNKEKNSNFSVDCESYGVKKARKSSAAPKPRKSSVSAIATNGGSGNKEKIKSATGVRRTKASSANWNPSHEEAADDSELAFAALNQAEKVSISAAVSTPPSQTVENGKNLIGNSTTSTMCARNEEISKDGVGFSNDMCKRVGTRLNKPKSLKKVETKEQFGDCVHDVNEQFDDQKENVHSTDNALLQEPQFIKNMGKKDKCNKVSESTVKRNSDCSNYEILSRECDGFSIVSKTPGSATKKVLKQSATKSKCLQTYKHSKNPTSSSEEQISDTENEEDALDVAQRKAARSNWKSREVQHKEQTIVRKPNLDQLQLKNKLSGESVNKNKPCRKTIPKASGIAEGAANEITENGKYTFFENQDTEQHHKLFNCQLESPTATNLEKAKERLAEYVLQKKRNARSSPVTEKRKWKFSESNSDDDLRLESKTTNSSPQGRIKSRRAATRVSYKEPSIGRKLRQGDPHTDNMFLESKKHRNKKRTQ